MSNSCKSDMIFVKMENFEGFDDKKFSPKRLFGDNGVSCKMYQLFVQKNRKNRGDSGRSPCLLMVRNIYNCLFGLLFVFQ